MSYIGKLGPALPSAADAERQLLVEATETFARRLKEAIERGDESVSGVLATVTEPAGFFPWRFTRGLP
jgi:hypothetical protein